MKSAGFLLAFTPTLLLAQVPTASPTPASPAPATPAPVTVPTTRTSAQDAAAAATGKSVTNAEIADAIRNSGLTEAQVRARLRAGGFDAKLADPFFSAGAEAPGASGAGRGTAEPGFVNALQTLGIISTDATDASDVGPDSVSKKTKSAESLAARRESSGLFGKDVFSSGSAFDPVSAGPVDASYRLGVGDQLQYVVTGEMELAMGLDVRRDGTVVIPQVGQVAIAGLTLEAARTVLTVRASRVFSVISSGKARIDLSVSRIRSNQVFVIGEVEHPGTYQVSALATVFRALVSAGGPTLRGTFRDIQVRRGNVVVAHVDLYDYLLRGDASHDIRTEQGDIIFVGLSTRVVAVQGAVRRPGIFEMRQGEGFSDLLELAGGLLPTAVTDRIQIDRVLPPEQRAPGRERALLDVPYSANPALLDTVKVFANDIVTVFSVGDIRRNQIVLRGEVYQPGSFEWTPGMTLGSLVQKAQGYLPWALLDRVKVQRPVVNSGRSEIFSIDVRDSTAAKFPVQEFDEVAVLDGRRAYPAGEVDIRGAVRNPGSHAYVDNETVGDLIDLANGFHPWALRREVKLTRTDLATGIRTQVSLDLQDSLSRRFRLSPQDQIVVLDARTVEIPATVTVSGAVIKPETYPYARNRTIRDLIALSGGLRPEAAQAELARRRIGATYSDTSSTVRRFTVLDDGSLSDAGDTITVERGDVLTFRVSPGMRTSLETVTLNGLFTYPGTYVLRRDGERISEMVARAGGVLPNAFLGAGRLLRQGRPVAVDLAKALTHDREQDLVLRSGDQLSVDADPAVVYVAGAVERQVVVPYRKDWSTPQYIDAAGGFSVDADPGNIVIEYPSGETHRRTMHFLGISGDVPVISGSTLTVGRKPVDTGGNVGETLTRTMQIVATMVSIFLTYKVATK